METPQLNSLYQQLILEHYRNPRNKSELDEKSVEVHLANPVCGDEIRLQLLIEDSHIAEARFVVGGLLDAPTARQIGQPALANLGFGQPRAQLGRDAHRPLQAPTRFCRFGVPDNQDETVHDEPSGGWCPPTKRGASAS
jgi:hypothetical protein